MEAIHQQEPQNQWCREECGFVQFYRLCLICRNQIQQIEEFFAVIH